MDLSTDGGGVLARIRARVDALPDWAVALVAGVAVTGGLLLVGVPGPANAAPAAGDVVTTADQCHASGLVGQLWYHFDANGDMVYDGWKCQTTTYLAAHSWYAATADDVHAVAAYEVVRDWVGLTIANGSLLYFPQATDGRATAFSPATADVGPYTGTGAVYSGQTPDLLNDPAYVNAAPSGATSAGGSSVSGDFVQPVSVIWGDFGSRLIAVAPMLLGIALLAFGVWFLFRWSKRVVG